MKAKIVKAPRAIMPPNKVIKDKSTYTRKEKHRERLV